MMQNIKELYFQKKTHSFLIENLKKKMQRELFDGLYITYLIKFRFYKLSCKTLGIHLLSLVSEARQNTIGSQ